MLQGVYGVPGGAQLRAGKTSSQAVNCICKSKRCFLTASYFKKVSLSAAVILEQLVRNHMAFQPPSLPTVFHAQLVCNSFPEATL